MLSVPKLIQQPVLIHIFGRQVLARRSRLQYSIGRARSADRVNHILQPRVAAFGKGGAIRFWVRQHSPAIREIQHVSVLRHIIDARAAAADRSRQPSLQVAHIDFDGIHNAIGGTGVIGRGGARPDRVARFAFAGIVEVDGIPVEAS